MLSTGIGLFLTLINSNIAKHTSLFLENTSGAKKLYNTIFDF
jgi:hypothetical protein